MRNPFVRFYDYITAKSVKQRIYIVIAIVFLLTFAVFFVKGNFFDNRVKTDASESSQITASDASENENAESADSTVTEQSSKIQFHFSVIDFVVLIAIIAVFVVKKIRDKIKNRRM